MKRIEDILGSEPGRVVEGMSLNDYLRLPYISTSSIVKARKSLLAVKWHYENDSATTDPMRLGCCIDHLLFEYGVPAALAGETIDASTFLEAWPLIEGKRQGSDWVPKSERPERACPVHVEYGVQYINGPAELRKITSLVHAVCNDPEARKHWGPGRAQLTMIANVEGITIKMRPDWIHVDIDDLKTSADISERKVSNQVFGELRYVDKMAAYRWAYKTLEGDEKGCNLIYAQSADEPDVAVVPIDQASLSLSEEWFLETCGKIRAAIDSGNWLGVAKGAPMPLEVPFWEMDQPQFQEIGDG